MCVCDFIATIYLIKVSFDASRDKVSKCPSLNFCCSFRAHGYLGGGNIWLCSETIPNSVPVVIAGGAQRIICSARN